MVLKYCDELRKYICNNDEFPGIITEGDTQFSATDDNLVEVAKIALDLRYSPDIRNKAARQFGQTFISHPKSITYFIQLKHSEMRTPLEEGEMLNEFKQNNRFK